MRQIEELLPKNHSKMAKKQETHQIEQHELEQEDKDRLQEFGLWLSSDAAQFQGVATGIEQCKSPDLPRKIALLCNSLSCINIVRTQHASKVDIDEP